MNTPSPPTLDPIAAHRWQRNAPALSPWLHEEAAQRMLERLQWIKPQPTSWLHWHAVRGGLKAHERLRQRYPKSKCFVLESLVSYRDVAITKIATPWWHPRTWLAPAVRFEAPPAGGVDMLWANMVLHLSAEPQALLARWHEALACDGFLMFSCLGPDTAREVRQVYEWLGWPAPASTFTDMHDWGDMLVQVGFAQPVMDMERITLTYATPARLLEELRELGRNFHRERFAHLRGRGWRQQLEQALLKHLKPQADGQLALTFEVIYGHAFKPQSRHAISTQTTISLEHMRALLKPKEG